MAHSSAMTNLLSWMALGLVAGFLAKVLMPGRNRGGLLATMILGVIGALLGGYLSKVIGFLPSANGFSLGGIITATVGALLFLIVHRALTK
jgi:uncharacterized membrane protein YeaQ/YmgE (transglycosylase-associated protein family)